MGVRRGQRRMIMQTTRTSTRAPTASSQVKERNQEGERKVTKSKPVCVHSREAPDRGCYLASLLCNLAAYWRKQILTLITLMRKLAQGHN
eukprot:1155474-Pelagomonas_calceolata.AAC.3